MSFSLHTVHIGTTILLHLEGRMDSLSVAALQEQLNLVFERYAPQDLILNMAQVNYLSAAGLRLLHTLHERTGQVRIACPSPRVMEVMQITGLNQVYGLYATETAAIHNVRPVTNGFTSLERGWMHHLRPDVGGLEYALWLNERLLTTFTSAKDSDARFQKAIETGIQALVQSGTTVVADVSVSGLSLAPLMASGLRGVVYLELAETTPQRAALRLARVQISSRTGAGAKRSDGIRVGLSLRSPAAFAPDHWRQIMAYAEREHLPLSIGVAQTAAERDFFLSGTGGYAAYQEVFPLEQAPHISPVAYLEDTGALALRPLLRHAIHIDEADMARIKAHDAAIVHCPRTELRLRMGRLALEQVLAAGVRVLLGTGSLASSPSLSLFDELDVAAALHYGRVPPAALIPLLHGTL